MCLFPNATHVIVYHHPLVLSPWIFLIVTLSPSHSFTLLHTPSHSHTLPPTHTLHLPLLSSLSGGPHHGLLLRPEAARGASPPRPKRVRPRPCAGRQRPPIVGSVCGRGHVLGRQSFPGDRPKRPFSRTRAVPTAKGAQRLWEIRYS
jgi:hypothetical protein